MVRGTQLLPHTRYTDVEARAYLSMGPHAEQRLALAVLPGGTLEVTLAQFWSSLGPGRLRVEVRQRVLIGYHPYRNPTSRHAPPDFHPGPGCSRMRGKVVINIMSLTRDRGCRWCSMA